MIFKSIALWLWNATPWWFKAPFLFIMTPIALVTVILWYALFLPWQNNQIQATVTNFNEKRDMKYEMLVERQNYINEQTKESLERIDRHQIVMMEYIMHNKK